MRSLPLLLSMFALTTHAAQVVVTDVAYTHSAQTTSDSHSMVNPLPGTPSNWVSPIDYAHGTAVVRLEVITKPTTIATRFQICFLGSPSYACTNQAPAYTTTGVYTWSTPFTNFYQYSQVNWSQGADEIALILKDTSNGKPAPENVGATESAKYMPTQLRVTVTLVSPGSTYVPPVDGAADAGVADAGPEDGGVPDAGQPEDAGIPDAGALDAGPPEDAGAEPADAGELIVTDAGTFEPPAPPGEPDPQRAGGCGCQSAPLGLSLLGLTLVLLRRRR